MNEQIETAPDDGAQALDIPLEDGDVRTIRVLYHDGEIRLLVFDDDDGLVPLVCAVLSAKELGELLRALAERV